MKTIDTSGYSAVCVAEFYRNAEMSSMAGRWFSEKGWLPLRNSKVGL